MRFVLTIDSENDALVNGHPDRLANILYRLSQRIGGGGMPGVVCDDNGNAIGTVEFEASEPEPKDDPDAICDECGEPFDGAEGHRAGPDSVVCPNCR